MSVYDKVKIQILSVKPRSYDELNCFAYTIFSAQPYPQKGKAMPLEMDRMPKIILICNNKILRLKISKLVSEHIAVMSILCFLI